MLITVFLSLWQVEIEDLTRQNSELHALIKEYKVDPSEEKDQDGTSPCEDSDAEGELPTTSVLTLYQIPLLHKEKNR